MRKLIESTLVSLDGVIEAPERWASFDAEASALSLEQLGNYDAFVMGRVTYEKFYANWGHTAGHPYTDLINAMPSTSHPDPSPRRPGTPPSSGPTQPARSPG